MTGGLVLGIWLPRLVPVLAGVACIILFMNPVSHLAGKTLPNWLGILILVTLLVALPLTGFAGLARTQPTGIPNYGLAIGFALGLGQLAGFFGISIDFWYARRAADLRKIWQIQESWLIVIWSLFPILAFLAWFPDIETAQLDAKLDHLAGYLIATPFILSGLPFWPLLALLSLSQFRQRRARRYDPEAFAATLPFWWQTFAYPLPGLQRYLVALGRARGPAVALQALQAVQFGSLQHREARRAALALAAAPETALPFCGRIAVFTNSATLLPFAQAGAATRALIALARTQEKESEKPLRLYVGEFPPKPTILGRWLKSRRPEWLEGFQKNRARPLPERLRYSLHWLKSLTDYAQSEAFRDLLTHFLDLAISDLQGIPARVAAVISDPRAAMNEEAIESDWLAQGWQMLARLAGALSPLEQYRELATPTARRELLQNRVAALQALDFEDCTWYWAGIGRELANLWIPRLNEAMQLAREWLRLELQLVDETLPQGRQSLRFRLVNPTGVLARRIRLIPEAAEGLEWGQADARRNTLEGGTEARLGLELETHRAGTFRIGGRLEAEDLDGRPFVLPFAFPLRIAVAGRPYRLPAYQPYVTGEGVASDQTFIGRGELLHWLRGLWLRPEGKPAVALVGQRRIGKTSLLNKIQRDGLPETGLLPVLVNVQGVAGEVDFLADVARQMAAHRGLDRPVLDRHHPYPDFKDFLLDLKPALGAQRFLLMLDEADLIPKRHLGDLLPGFLRALMQEPQYPVLLLFCGTHALKRMSADYSSILFNTVQFRTVSYLTESESTELLQKPARGLLEFDPAALDQAFRLSRGQPLLLQSLGATLVDRCNAVVLKGGERSDYISLHDLAGAADDLVRKGNQAFENHWEDSDPATHRVLSALAFATDESSRLQLDLPGIEAALTRTGLEIPKGMAFRIVERLAEEEILERDGPTYRYAVPLYRRWTAWRWPPERVREEPLGKA